MKLPEGQEIPSAFVEGVAKVREAQPSPADLAAAFPEQYAVQSRDGYGRPVTEWKGVPLTNPDGTKTAHGKNMIDLYAKSARVGREYSAKVSAMESHEVLVDASGNRKRVTARIAKLVADRDGMKPARHYGRPTTRSYHRDGKLVTVNCRTGEVVSER